MPALSVLYLGGSGIISSAVPSDVWTSAWRCSFSTGERRKPGRCRMAASN